jgi:hypothetical protein
VAKKTAARLSIEALKRESTSLLKVVKRRGTSGVSENTLELINDTIASIRIDRAAAKFSKAKLKAPARVWPFPLSAL